MNVKPNMNYLPSLFLFPLFISISFNRFIVYISFAQILFLFQSNITELFPFDWFLTFRIVSTNLFVSLTYMIFTELSVYLFTSMNQDLYSSLTKTNSYTTFRNDRFLHTSWVFGFVYDNILFTLKITRIRIGLCTTWLNLWT